MAGPSTATVRKAQSSRKGKTAWRKNIDTREIDDHLESQRVAERLGATLVDPSSAKDSELFQVDVEGDQKVASRMAEQARSRKKKPMRSLRVLENTSAVPGILRRGKGAVANTSSRKGTGKMSKVEQDRLRRMAKRAVKGPFGAIEDESERMGLQALESVKGAVMRLPEEDPWQQGQASAAGTSTSSTAVTAAAGVKQTGALPGLSALPQTGQSYNPSLSSHNALLQRAFEVEKVRAAKDQEERDFKQRWIQAGKHARELEADGDTRDHHGDITGNRKKQSFAGMLIGSGDEEGSSDDEGVDGSVAGLEDSDGRGKGESEARSNSALATGQRKTRQQRLKEARIAAASRQALKKRLFKEEASLMARLPSLSKAMQRRLRERAQRLTERRIKQKERTAKEGLAGKRFGKHKVPEDVASRSALEVQLGEDLSESLRGVKRHEGMNLFRDVWDSLTARGLAEPSKPVERKGRGEKRKFKEYETHAYKRFV